MSNVPQETLKFGEWVLHFDCKQIYRLRYVIYFCTVCSFYIYIISFVLVCPLCWPDNINLNWIWMWARRYTGKCRTTIQLLHIFSTVKGGSCCFAVLVVSGLGKINISWQISQTIKSKKSGFEVIYSHLQVAQSFVGAYNPQGRSVGAGSYGDHGGYGGMASDASSKGFTWAKRSVGGFDFLKPSSKGMLSLEEKNQLGCTHMISYVGNSRSSNWIQASEENQRGCSVIPWCNAYLFPEVE